MRKSPTKKTTPRKAASPTSASSEEQQEQSLRDYKVTIEYKHLKSHAPGGVYLVPSLDSLRKFDGVIFVRRGPFTNGIFKFVLELPPTYNDVNTYPQIRFLSPVYNPHVYPDTGILDIKTAYPRWDPSRHYLVTVLTLLKRIFYAKNYDDAVANPEARRLAETNPTAFRTQVDKCVNQSEKSVYDNAEDSAVKFSEEKLNHRVMRDLLKDNIKDPTSISKNSVLQMIDRASQV